MDKKPVGRDPLPRLIIWFCRQTTFDHPPPNTSLQPKKRSQADQPPDHRHFEVPPRAEVNQR
jgi:hypothetical protein